MYYTYDKRVHRVVSRDDRGLCREHTTNDSIPYHTNHNIPYHTIPTIAYHTIPNHTMVVYAGTWLEHTLHTGTQVMVTDRRSWGAGVSGSLSQCDKQSV